MPVVSKPDRFASDVIIPGRVADDDGFVTENHVLETPIGGQTIYFSIAGLRQLAAKYPQVGLVPADLLADAEQEVGRWQAAAEQAEARVAELEAQQERIAGFAREGFKVQKVIGRPKEKA